jgi:hypothetical protein
MAEAGRSIPPWLALIIQELELNRPAFVTTDDVRRSMPKYSVS